MFPDTYRQVSKLIGYTGSLRIRFLLGVVGQSLNVLLATYLGADLSGKVISAIETRNIKALYDSVEKVLPLLVSIVLIHSISRYLTECGCVAALANIRTRLFSKMLYSSIFTADNEHSGKKLSYLLNDAPVAVNGLGKILQIPLTALFMGAGGLIYVVAADIRIAFVTLAVGIFTLVYSVFFSHRLRRSSDKAQSALAVAGEKLKDLLDGAVTARIYNMRKMLEDRYNDAANDARNAGVRFARDSALLGGLNNAQHHIGEKLLVFTAGIFLLDGVLDLPQLVSISQMAGGVVGVFHISRILPEVQKTLAGAERIFNVIDNFEDECGGSESIDPENGEKAIVLSGVSFCYGERNPLVENISFSVDVGEIIALIGESGSGKSTVLRLILGLLEPQEGNIRIFGTDSRAAKTASLRRIISFVSQDVVLFAGTIKENIAIGCENATNEQIIRAAADANAHEFISELENGYNTYVSERGLSLSGGQRQRISMARAFLRNAPIILFDEASSALDPVNEELFKQSLLSKKGKHTIVVVTHSPSIAGIADRIINI